MKLLNLIAIATLSVMLVACNPDKTDNTIYGERTEMVGWQPSPDVTKNPIPKYDTTVLISPTWNQANHYASERKDFWIWMAIGTVLLLAFGVFVYGLWSDASWFPKISTVKTYAIMWVLLVAAASSYYWIPGSIRWSNDKWVKKEVYNKAIQETGSTKPIWDSLRNECRIVSGPYECYETK